MAALLLISLSLSFLAITSAYRAGDIVPMSKMGQYHSSRTVWHDMIGKHCPIFAVNHEICQVGREKFLILWLFLINCKSSEVPMIDVHLTFTFILISVNSSGILNIGQNMCLSDNMGLMLSFILSIYIFAVIKGQIGFVTETVAESTMLGGEPKVE